MRSQIATSSLRSSVSRKKLYAFTLEGVKLLPNVLRGENVSNVTLKIIDAFKEKENEFKTIKNTDKIGTFSEIVKFESGDIILDINVSPEEDTVWLTQTDMAILFDTSKQNISLHILNIFNEKELLKDSVVKESLTTGLDGKKYNIMFYNLDVVISVGYRVKSKRGVEFRKWANNILKQYLLKGYTVNTKRCLEHSDIIFKLNDELNVLINNISKYDSKVKKIEKDIAMLKDNFIDPNSYAFFNYERRKNRGGFGIPNYI